MKNFVIENARAFARVMGAAVLMFGAMLVSNVSVTDAANAGTLTTAKRFLGMHEVKHNKALRRTVGVNPRRTPWCGAFVAAIVKMNGKAAPKGHARAASWKRWGKGVPLKKARKGDVVVIRTKRGHHVGFFAGFKDGRVTLLGGNQSNRVKYSNYRIRSVQAVRRAI